jgi:intracellular septation protein A
VGEPGPGAGGEAALNSGSGLEAPRVRAVLRATGPRVARDGFGPLLAFFVAWKLVGLLAGIAAAVITAALLFGYERRRGRPGMVVRLALGLVLIRAVVGLISGSASTYLAQEIAIDILLSSAFLGSLLARRPLTEFFATEIYPLPEAVRRHPVYRRTHRVITLAWGGYFLARAGVRLLAFVSLSSSGYVLVVALTDVPFLLALLAWSVWYAAHSLRREPELLALAGTTA